MTVDLIPITVSGEVVESPSLDDLAATTRNEHALVIEAGEAVVEHAIRAGEALLAAKQLVPKGEWIAWLETNILDEGRKLTTITAYMRMARYKDELRAIQAGTLKVATHYLSGKADSRIDPLERDEVQRLRRQGATYSDISNRLGISKPKVWRLANPDSYERAKRKHYTVRVAEKRALKRQEQERTVRSAGGPTADAYALIRRALQRLDQASQEATDPEVRRHLTSAISRLHNVEDQIGMAVRKS